MVGQQTRDKKCEGRILINAWLCRRFGHPSFHCENGCSTHGFCNRCDYWTPDGKKWYAKYADAPPKKPIFSILNEFAKYIHMMTIDKDLPFKLDNTILLTNEWLQLSYIKDWSKMKELLE